MNPYNSLISLLDDPDERVFSAVKQKFIEIGADAVPALERLYGSSENMLAISRSEQLLNVLRSQSIFTQFENWCKNGNGELFSFFYYLDAVVNEPYPKDILDALVSPIVEMARDSISPSLSPLKKIKLLNYIIYSVYQYAEAVNTPNASRSLSLRYALDNQIRVPYIMAIIYLEVAQRAGFSLRPVLLPDVLCLAYLSPDGEVLFYINPVNEGAVFTSQEIATYLDSEKRAKFKEYIPNPDSLQVALVVLEKFQELLHHSHSDQLALTMEHFHKIVEQYAGKPTGK